MPINIGTISQQNSRHKNNRPPQHPITLLFATNSGSILISSFFFYVFYYNHENRDCQVKITIFVYSISMKIFGERLRELRAGRGLTQKQLAAILNVSGNTVHAWETDKQEPSMAVLLFMSEFFNVTLDFLFGKSDY